MGFRVWVAGYGWAGEIGGDLRFCGFAWSALAFRCISVIFVKSFVMEASMRGWFRAESGSPSRADNLIVLGPRFGALFAYRGGTTFGAQ